MKRVALILAALLCMASRHPDRMIRSDILLNCSFNRGDGSTRSMVDRTPTLTNGAVVTAGNRYLTLDGANDYLSFPDADDLSFGNGGTDSPFSISMWIKTTAPTTRQFLISKRTLSVYEWQLEYRATAGAGLELVLAASNASAIISRYDAGRTLTSGQWYHVVATYSGGKTHGSIRLYQDGGRVDDTSGAAPSYAGMSNTTNPVSIGCLPTNVLPFAGDIDDVRIYNRELTAAEVAAIYSSGRE